MNTSGRYSGQRAQLLLPPLRENDTHCLSFQFYQAGGREGAAPATLNVYVTGTAGAWLSVGGALDVWVELSGVSVLPTENNSPLGVPVINSSGPAYHIWKGVELAVSTFWPNQYQVKHAHTPGLQALHCWDSDDVAPNPPSADGGRKEKPKV